MFVFVFAGTFLEPAATARFARF